MPNTPEYFDAVMEDSLKRQLCPPSGLDLSQFGAIYRVFRSLVYLYPTNSHYCRLLLELGQLKM